MFKIFIGLIIVVIGVFIFIIGYYYGWRSNNPGVSEYLFNRYQIIAPILIYSSFIVVAGGFIYIKKAINKINKKNSDPK